MNKMTAIIFIAVHLPQLFSRHSPDGARSEPSSGSERLPWQAGPVVIGERQAARLEEAVAAYRAALEEWTREAAPHWHDIAQQNVARCLALLGQRRNP